MFIILGQVVQSWVKIKPRVSVKSALRYESFEVKFSIIFFVYNLMIACSKENTGD